MTRNRRTKRPAIAWLAALALGSPAAAQMLSMPTPQIDWEQRLGQVVPDDIALTDSTGARVTVGSLESGRPVVLALVYYECPMLCNLVLDGLTSALGEVSFDAGDEFDVWVVSIDPGETPEMAADRRARYLEAGSLPGRAEGWRFLVGTQDAVHALAMPGKFDAAGLHVASHAPEDCPICELYEESKRWVVRVVLPFLR